ncbi:unnamed protein product, partial [Gongylonema pulchrum]|uniref:C2H2-type domain-containing protein n=1 Tax=Gongylonema pulchrum TaxID=637853 RepID=A0A183D552_9BILA
QDDSVKVGGDGKKIESEPPDIVVTISSDDEEQRESDSQDITAARADPETGTSDSLGLEQPRSCSDAVVELPAIVNAANHERNTVQRDSISGEKTKLYCGGERNFLHVWSTASTISIDVCQRIKAVSGISADHSLEGRDIGTKRARKPLAPLVRKGGRMAARVIEDQLRAPVYNAEATFEKIFCQKCGEKVDDNYLSRRCHVLAQHVRADDPEINILLSSTVQACFPSFTDSSDYQCTGCGKEFASASGRKNHVLKEHFDWSVVCPLRGCSDIYSTTSEMKQHFQV